MDIKAVGHLRYFMGRTISTYPERLEIVAKFKDPNKMFRQTISSSIVYKINSRNPYGSHGTLHCCDSREEFLTYTENFIDDQERIREAIEDMVKEYFNQENENKEDETKINRIGKKINKVNKEKIKVIVKIKN